MEHKLFHELGKYASEYGIKFNEKKSVELNLKDIYSRLTLQLRRISMVPHAKSFMLLKTLTRVHMLQIFSYLCYTVVPCTMFL